MKNLVFNLSKKRTAAICDEIIRRKIKIAFSIHARCDTMNEKTILKLKNAGCARVQYGIETADPATRGKMNRKGRENNDHTRNIFRLTRKYGMSTAAYLICGLPYQTHESYVQTLKFLKNLAIDYTIALPAYIGPGTRDYASWVENHGGKDFWREATLSGNSDPEVLLENMPQYISLEEKLRYVSQYLRVVYVRPMQVLNIFTKHVFSPFSMASKMRAALQIMSIIKKYGS